MAEKYKTEEALKNKTWAIQLTNLRDIHLNPQKAYEPEVKGNRSSIWVLICTALAILCMLGQLYQCDGRPVRWNEPKRSVYVGLGGKPEAGYFTVPFRIVGDEQYCFYPGYRADGGVDAFFQ